MVFVSSDNIFNRTVHRILSSLLKHAPGHIRCQLLLAQAQYLEGSFDAVMQRASAVQHTNPGDGQASLLLCQVYLHKKNISGARIALDEAVAASFSIRDLPCYHIVNAQVLMAEGRLDEAKNVSGHHQLSVSLMYIP